jgi:hypothetical protein
VPSLMLPQVGRWPDQSGGTHLSPELEAAISRGEINLRYIP